jgi:molybdate transport system ATP-binding protein
MQPLIQVANALCRIGRHGVLKVEDFQILPGQHWCVFGANGAGKSLLGNLISAKRIESRNYVAYAENFDPARDIQIVSFEEQQRLWRRDNRLDISEYSANALDPGTIVESLIRTSRPGDTQDETLFAELIEQLDLSDVVGKGIRFLSSGQIRRVLIARALYAYQKGVPQLLVLDDPLESIDKDSQQRITHCIENFIHDGFSSLQLCRRASDILPGVTHMAIMQDLEMVSQGSSSKIMGSEIFKKLTTMHPVLPEQIPLSSIEQRATLSADEPFIRLDKVNASYGELRVLEEISWTMLPHHHVLIEGPNGCGKSTLLSLIDGENHKGYGQNVYLFGRLKGSGETVWDIKAQFGIVSNELHNKYVRGWKVLDVVVSGFFDSVGLYDDSGAAEADVAKSWLSVLGISDLEKHYYHEISFGQQRLVLLARAMVKHPAVLILDEPCVGLDDYHRELILGMLDLIASQSKTRILYVSHVVGEQPSCINQKLSFVKNEAGGFAVVETSD